MERAVIVLAYGSGLSQSEIAARLDWPIGTVKTRTRRALARLRERLDDTHGSAGAPGATKPRPAIGPNSERTAKVGVRRPPADRPRAGRKPGRPASAMSPCQC